MDPPPKVISSKFEPTDLILFHAFWVLFIPAVLLVFSLSLTSLRNFSTSFLRSYRKKKKKWKLLDKSQGNNLSPVYLIAVRKQAK